MKLPILATAIVALAGAGPALAASSQVQQGGSSPGAAAPATTGSTSSAQSLAAAQEIQKDLQSAGFTDVKVVAESFVVQAKTKDGNPVVMTIGPHGMSVFEAMNAAKPSTNNTASNAPASSSASGTTMQK